MAQNLYLIGDADDKLKDVASGSVKLIYIDPPYNTGSKFLYNDKRARDEWAAFMRPKLKESKRVLTNDGVIFISIDDNEYDRLKVLCDEVFGEANKLGTLITRQATRSNSKHINTIHEYVLCYARDAKKAVPFSTLRTNIPLYGKTIRKISRDVKSAFKSGGQKAAEAELKKLLRHYEHIDGYSWLRNYSSVDDKGNVYFGRDLSTPGAPNRLQIPEIGLDLRPLKTRGWASKERMLQLHKEGKLVFKAGRPYQKTLLTESRDSLMSMLNFYSRQGQHDLDRLGMKHVFDTPKPVDMMKLFILCTCSDDDVVLDYFSGSATTGQAVWEVNNEQGSNLTFILVQLPEPVGKDTPAGKLLARHKLKPDVANLGILRLRLAKEKLGLHEDFVVKR